MCLFRTVRGWLALSAVFALLLAASAPAGASPIPFTITPTFDATITSNANAAAIQNEVNRAIGIYQSLFTDPITISIYFRYANTGPNGVTLSSGTLAQSDYTVYSEVFGLYTAFLGADKKSANDATAVADLPSESQLPNYNAANSMKVDVSSANGRAVGLNTPTAMNSSGGVGSGTGFIYDGIVTLNSSASIQFTRANLTSTQNDGQRLVEHEIDEVLGLGSILSATTDFTGHPAVKPEDLFRYSSANTLSLSTAAASSYLSINKGSTSIAGFNQTSGGDYGDWASGSCPQATALVQYAFSCPGTAVDISATSAEGVALDVIGYDSAAPEPGTFVLLGAGLAVIAARRRSRG